eukprot:CAMPEP_0184673504 /NCGR_PEP_ID=MMETSP0308-20130426/86719_1 /TAXON_ID=38269 /ORGANISM="Gloeochaete witrockiana, Strain SAG 46.84" /LENGTH=980 /DNA_ID=CAMNT_0027121001 /DNA_START=111 /DNA_END=3050 /DNA_ORIENTATION=+
MRTDQAKKPTIACKVHDAVSSLQNQYREKGDLVTWGRGNEFQLGNGQAETGDQPQVVRSLLEANIRQVACGKVHSAAITDKGVLYTWGTGGSFLGHGSDQPSSVPKLVEGLRSVSIKQVACGNSYTAALSDDGEVWTWGCGGAGVLGHGSTNDHPTPRLIKSLVGEIISKIACGPNHMMAISQSGDVWSWGEGKWGALGHGRRQTVDEPLVISSLSGASVVDISCGTLHSAAVTGAGEVFTWGHGDGGQLGHEYSSDLKAVELSPRLVQMLADCNVHARHVVCGSRHTAILAEDGRVWAFGSGPVVGDATGASPRRLPMLLSAFDKHPVIRLVTGPSHMAALTQGGGLFVWGAGGDFRLGARNAQGQPQDLDTLAVSHSSNSILPLLKCKGGIVDIALGESFSAIVIRHWALASWKGLLPPHILCSNSHSRSHTHTQCASCSVQLSFWRRPAKKCRYCASDLCSMCSSERVSLPRFGFRKPLRVCSHCYKSLASTEVDAALEVSYVSGRHLLTDLDRSELYSWTVLIKSCEKKRPHFRLFRLSQDDRQLEWVSYRHCAGGSVRHVELCQVIDVRRNESVSDLCPRPEWLPLSFSLVLEERTLCIVCKDKEEQQLWFRGLAFLLASLGQRVDDILANPITSVVAANPASRKKTASSPPAEAAPETQAPKRALTGRSIKVQRSSTTRGSIPMLDNSNNNVSTSNPTGKTSSSSPTSNNDTLAARSISRSASASLAGIQTSLSPTSMTPVLFGTSSSEASESTNRSDEPRPDTASAGTNPPTLPHLTVSDSSLTSLPSGSVEHNTDGSASLSMANRKLSTRQFPVSFSDFDSISPRDATTAVSPDSLAAKLQRKNSATINGNQIVLEMDSDQSEKDNNNVLYPIGERKLKSFPLSAPLASRAKQISRSLSAPLSADVLREKSSGVTVLDVLRGCQSKHSRTHLKPSDAKTVRWADSTSVANPDIPPAKLSGSTTVSDSNKSVW